MTDSSCPLVANRTAADTCLLGISREDTYRWGFPPQARQGSAARCFKLPLGVLSVTSIHHWPLSAADVLPRRSRMKRFH